MKRQPIASAAAFFVLHLESVEKPSGVGECVDSFATATDGIFCCAILY